jgi:hypothetical protein
VREICGEGLLDAEVPHVAHDANDFARGLLTGTIERSRDAAADRSLPGQSPTIASLG